MITCTYLRLRCGSHVKQSANVLAGSVLQSDTNTVQCPLRLEHFQVYVKTCDGMFKTYKIKCQ